MTKDATDTQVNLLAKALRQNLENPPERVLRRQRSREERQQAKHEWEKNVRLKVERISDAALERARQGMINGEFDVVQAMAEYEEGRLAALASFPVQAAAAITATTNKCKLVGLMIERTEHGLPGSFAAVKTREDVFRILEERAGSDALKAFQQFLTKLDASENARLEDKI